MSSNDLESDVVVVGSGMGGGTTSYALAQKGVNVLVLERGERLPSERSNWDPKEVFLDKKYKSKEIWIDKDGKNFSAGVHFYVGGNTKLYGAALPRLKEKDFGEINHKEGKSPAWPFDYWQLEPFYNQAEKMYKVHGNCGEDPTEPGRSQPFPYPALAHEPYVAAMATRLKQAGVTPHSNSMGIDYGDDGKCIRCKTCDGFVCRVGAKSDAEINAINPALLTGRVKLQTSAEVIRIELSADGKKVDHLVVNGPNGIYKVKGKKYVLSCGAVLTAALLLKSKCEKAPNGAANSSNLVGRNFMMHVNTHIAAFDWARKNDVVFQKTLSFSDWYFDGGDGYPLGIVQLIGKVQGVMMKSYATRVLLPLLNFIADRSVEFLVMTEDLPSKENRVKIDKNNRINLIRTPIGMKTHKELLEKTLKILRKCGYKAIFKQPFDISMNAHQCGTAIAGHDPKTSVVDQYCKSHDLENLYLIDGSFFPSSGAVNPALTIAAQALRVVSESDLAS